MDIERIYSDYSVIIADSSDKHYREGWVNTSCPFCTGNPGYHLGYNTQNGYFYCWRCGAKPEIKTLSKLLGISYNEAAKITKQYFGKSKNKTHKVKVKKLQFKLPSLVMPITQNKLAVQYMTKKRGFSKRDVSQLEKRFTLMATGFGSEFDNMDLSYRIIAPIVFKGEIISWQSRDISGNSTLKYLTCPQKREKVDHKTILYNQLNTSGTVLLVEGIFDVWKCYLAGFRAVSTFGVEYTFSQLKQLLSYKKVVNFLDPDRAGKKHAKELKNRLVFGGKESEIVQNNLGIDAGDMTTEEIKKIVQKYFK